MVCRVSAYVEAHRWSAYLVRIGATHICTSYLHYRANRAKRKEQLMEECKGCGKEFKNKKALAGHISQLYRKPPGPPPQQSIVPPLPTVISHETVKLNVPGGQQGQEPVPDNGEASEI